MSFDGEIDARLGPLKRAAIDAYMKTQSWQVSDDRYTQFMAKSGLGSSPIIIHVVRPNADGDGGGETHFSDPAGLLILRENYADSFNNIRDRIKELVLPWRTVKEPNTIKGHLMKSLESVFNYISPSGSEVGGGTGVQAQITEIQRHLGDMTGGTIAAYKTNFLGVLDDVSNNLYMLAANNAAALAASKGAIEGAQGSFLQALEAGTDAFNSVTEKSNGFKLAITILHSASAALTAFLQGPGQIAAGGVSLVVGIIDALLPQDPEEESGAPKSFSEAMGKFEEMIDNVNDTLRIAEEDIARQTQDVFDITISQQVHFDLSLRETVSDDDAGPEMHIDPTAMKDITSRYMPEITEGLAAAAKAAENAKITDEVQRDGSIGYSEVGASREIANLTTRLVHLLKDLSWETSVATHHLRLAVLHIQQKDEVSGEALRKLEEHIQSNPYDPYDEYS